LALNPFIYAAHPSLLYHRGVATVLFIQTIIVAYFLPFVVSNIYLLMKCGPFEWQIDVSSPCTKFCSLILFDVTCAFWLFVYARTGV
jgi:hypothetical protein